MYKKALYLVFSFFFTTLTFAQQHEFHLYNADKDFLAELVKKEVDKVRKKQKEDPLSIHVKLEKAALHHAKYEEHQPNISHYQNKKSTRTLSQRVKKYGGKFVTVGENIVRVGAASTYEKIAKQMVYLWVHSPGHYRNMINPNYNITGLKISINTKKAHITAVQVFGQTKKDYYTRKGSYYTVNPKTKKAKLPFGIKPYKTSPKTNQIIAQAAVGGSEGGVYSFNPLALKKLFRHKKDGVVSESVAYTPVSCQSTFYKEALSRRNKNSSVNGVLNKPTYKKDLMIDKHFKMSLKEFEDNKKKELQSLEADLYSAKKDFKGIKGSIRSSKLSRIVLLNPISLFLDKRVNQKRERHKENIAEQKEEKPAAKKEVKEYKFTVKKKKKEPWNPSYWFSTINISASIVDSLGEVNLLLLHRNRIVGVLYYKSVCGTAPFDDNITYQNPFDTLQFEFIPDTMYFEKKLGFSTGKTEPDSTEISTIKTILDSYRIDSIAIKAFASVEGQFEKNKELSTKRAHSIFDNLSFFSSDSTHYQVNHFQNWELLHQQIQDSKFSYIDSLSNADKIKEINTLKTSDTWQKWLYEQRKAQVNIKAIGGISDSIAYLFEHLPMDSLPTATTLLHYLVTHYKQHHWSPEVVYNLTFPRRDSTFSDLKVQKFIFEYDERISSDSTFNVKHFYSRFSRSFSRKKCLSSSEFQRLQFTIANYNTLYKRKAITPYRIFEWLQSFDNHHDKSYVTDTLWRLFFVKSLPHYWKYFNSTKMKYYNRFKYAEKAITVGATMIYEYYSNQDDIMNNQYKVLQLSDYFIRIHHNQLALQILEKRHALVGFEQLIYQKILKLQYAHPSYDNEQFVDVIKKAIEDIGQENWCLLFQGPCRISFQLMDSPQFREFFCSQCEAFSN